MVLIPFVIKMNNELPKARYCTCKNTACRTRFWIDPEDSLTCPACGILHCPVCLGSCEGIQINEQPFIGHAHWGTNVTGNCTHCGYEVIDYDYQ